MALLHSDYRAKSHNDLLDERFQALLSKQAWTELPLAVQRRFSKRVSGGESVVYVGKITKMRMSWLGQALANLLRLVGAPLPLKADVGSSTVVSVTEDSTQGGQIWTRLYANRHGFPQAVHSVKRFSGHTGLEEYIGFGLNMALNTRVVEQVLHFESAGYVLGVFGRRFKLPRVLAPLDLVVKHDDAGVAGFVFSLRVTNPLFGELIFQEAIYHEESLV
jgi:hypothetical protein